MTRLMCSQDRSEVESVKKELFKAGIVSEIRNNPLAQALRVTRVELWVNHDRDFIKASKLFAGIQARSGNSGRGVEVQVEPEEVADLITIDEDKAPAKNGRPKPTANNSSNNGADSEGAALQQASESLEKDIEELLQREADLADTCAGLRAELDKANQAVSDAKAELARERDARNASEKRRDAERSELHEKFEREKGARQSAEEQLEREKRDFQAQLKSRDHAVKEVQQKLDLKVQQLEHQQNSVVELRKEVVALASRLEEEQKTLHKAQAQLEVERDARLAAEERAGRALSAQAGLEKELADQKMLQLQVQASLANVNSIRSRLQAKKVDRAA